MATDASQPAGSNEPAAAAEPRNLFSEEAAVGRPMAIASEVLMVALWTVAADLLIFRGRGYFAVAAFFTIAIVSLFIVHQLRDSGFDAGNCRVFVIGGCRPRSLRCC